eukprot:11736702-Heterocapsa_arctica.AAC.1
MRATIDAELRIVWGDTLQEGSGWVRYLGKEWQCRQGCYSVRVLGRAPSRNGHDLLQECVNARGAQRQAGGELTTAWRRGPCDLPTGRGQGH